MVTPAGTAETIKEWVAKYDRPTVYNFDDRTISSIFGDQGVGFILFQQSGAGGVLTAAFELAAYDIKHERSKPFIFTQI